MPRRIKTMSEMAHHNGESTGSLFGAQINPSDMPSLEPKTLEETERFRTKYISLDDVSDNTENRFAITSTNFLARSIRKLGQLQPVIVIPIMENGRPSGKYEIKAGSRRLIAIRSIHEEAEKNGDADTAEKFSKIFCIILPEGATEEEIQSVITETNTTSRQLSIEDIFRNFDIIFEQEPDGNYKYLPKGNEKYKTASSILKDMGFSFSPSSVKDYLSIYTAHNLSIKKALEAGLLSKRMALNISHLPDRDQDFIMQKFNELDEKTFAKWLKAYMKERKEKKKKIIKGADVLTKVNSAAKGIENLGKKNIMFTDDMQREQLSRTIERLKMALDELEKKMQA